MRTLRKQLGCQTFCEMPNEFHARPEETARTLFGNHHLLMQRFSMVVSSVGSSLVTPSLRFLFLNWALSRLLHFGLVLSPPHPQEVYSFALNLSCRVWTRKGSEG